MKKITHQFVEMLDTPVHQTVLYGKRYTALDAPSAGYIGREGFLALTEGNTRVATLATEEEPLIVSFSGGFSADGLQDDILKMTSGLEVNLPPVGRTPYQYIYVELSEDGTPSLGVTNYAPVYLNALRPVVLNPWMRSNEELGFSVAVNNFSSGNYPYQATRYGGGNWQTTHVASVASPNWFEMTFDQPVFLHSAELMCCWEGTSNDVYLIDFELQVWDGADWVTVASKTGGTRVTKQIHVLEAASMMRTSKARILITDDSGASDIDFIQFKGIPAGDVFDIGRMQMLSGEDLVTPVRRVYLGELDRSGETPALTIYALRGQAQLETQVLSYAHMVTLSHNLGVPPEHYSYSAYFREGYGNYVPFHNRTNTDSDSNENAFCGAHRQTHRTQFSFWDGRPDLPNNAAVQCPTVEEPTSRSSYRAQGIYYVTFRRNF
ncbi:MAG: hypothetical protein LHW56_01720 [Candidatus Cloacimonetes bacterium]|nr:hypothetical protein [Candidatus Cloacimonadota bacterium]MDY0171606.1 hypothetical protein [Candidatus Cloacimonadaceae bacterium]